LSAVVAGTDVFGGSTIRTTLASGRGPAVNEIDAGETLLPELAGCQFPAATTAGSLAGRLAGDAAEMDICVGGAGGAPREL